MSKNAHVMGILFSLMWEYYICWRGHLLIRRWAVQTSQEEPSRIISEVFPRPCRIIYNSQSWGRCGIGVAHDTDKCTMVMWMYRIHLYGDYYTANHNRRWVSEEIFETPMFDLQDKASIKSLVRLRYPDAVDCDNVQVFFHEQVSK